MFIKHLRRAIVQGMSPRRGIAPPLIVAALNCSPGYRTASMGGNRAWTTQFASRGSSCYTPSWLPVDAVPALQGACPRLL
jgi:hypothetical protein